MIAVLARPIGELLDELGQAAAEGRQLVDDLGGDGGVHGSG